MSCWPFAHLDEIEEFADAGCHYRPIRHHLGITAFGVTAWTARAAGDLVIKRTAAATEDGTTIIALEGTPGKAYEARGWELWAPLPLIMRRASTPRSPTV